jgi:hypothetical protein
MIMEYNEVLTDTFSIETGNGNSYGTEKEVFFSVEPSPCSIIVTDNQTPCARVNLQVKKGEFEAWQDYDEGQMIISKYVSVRANCSAGGGQIKVRILS